MRGRPAKCFCATSLFALLWASWSTVEATPIYFAGAGMNKGFDVDHLDSAGEFRGPFDHPTQATVNVTLQSSEALRSGQTAASALARRAGIDSRGRPILGVEARSLVKYVFGEPALFEISVGASAIAALQRSGTLGQFADFADTLVLKSLLGEHLRPVVGATVQSAGGSHTYQVSAIPELSSGLALFLGLACMPPWCLRRFGARRPDRDPLPPLLLLSTLLAGCASSSGSTQVHQVVTPNSDGMRSIAVRVISAVPNSEETTRELEGAIVERLRQSKAFENVYSSISVVSNEADATLNVTITKFRGVSRVARDFGGIYAGRSELVADVELRSVRNPGRLGAATVGGSDSLAYGTGGPFGLSRGTIMEAIQGVAEQVASFVIRK